MATRRKKPTTNFAKSDRLLLLNKESGAVEGWCEDFDGLVGMVRPSRASSVAAFRLGSVYGSLDPSRLGASESGLFQVCLDSFLKPV
jgi:hypothetical protein